MPGKKHSNPIARFAAKCEFKPGTGCVLWTGAKTRGRGKTVTYGSFWYEGKAWRAHRWSAEFIHGQDFPDDYQVDHECNDPMCVEHVQAIPAPVNRELQWIRVQVGTDELEDEERPEHDKEVPFHEPPDWLKPFMKKAGESNDPPF